MRLIANDLPYRLAEEDFRQSLETVIALSSRDWGQERDLAWIYGIVFGWGPDTDDESEDCRPEIAVRFGWDTETMARLDRLHDQFKAADKPASKRPALPEATVNSLRCEATRNDSQCVYYGSHTLPHRAYDQHRSEFTWLR